MTLEQASEQATNVAAVCAVASPLWLHQLSDGVQFLLPFLGATWLLVQIIAKVGPWVSSLFRKTP